ncbi:PQQ-binding-like beta-propeller repeat protein [Hyalangium rubrum]|uniref:PQQ-binding-like beta-propeller repeat protein n=1 Tax=Hyalangium rubrum TaxID=3103134 RepID=A0ABU5H7V0_9BACT|nr:PQQ-binding-like beta-propeller repeat protein [Hyalangium sp. s54d21]MDY7229179.1 PQQ-binding-like beta-propeller repeat protein [Hyalangium sp. s54d21]
MLPRACPCTVILLVLLVTGVSGCQKPAERVFEFSTDASSRAGMVALEDSVVLGNEVGAVVRLDRRGEPVWRVKFAQEVAARPTVSGNSVIVGTVGGELASLGLADSTERWRVTGEPPVLTPLVSDTTSVYVLGPDGAVRAHALDTGKLRWRRPPPKAEEARIDPTQRLPTPVLGEGVLVVSLGEAGLMGLSTTDGAIRWRHPLPQPLGMTREGDTLYASARTGRVIALAIADGVPRWEQAPATGLTSPPTYALGTLWVGAEPPELLALSPSDGKRLSGIALPAPLVTQLAVYGNLLLVATSSRQGQLLGLRSQGGPPVFSLRTDTPLRTPPVVVGDQLFVLGLDGRVLSWSLRVPDP